MSRMRARGSSTNQVFTASLLVFGKFMSYRKASVMCELKLKSKALFDECVFYLPYTFFVDE
jgi:hypothetical protein